MSDDQEAVQVLDQPVVETPPATTLPEPVRTMRRLTIADTLLLADYIRFDDAVKAYIATKPTIPELAKWVSTTWDKGEVSPSTMHTVCQHCGVLLPDSASPSSVEVKLLAGIVQKIIDDSVTAADMDTLRRLSS